MATTIDHLSAHHRIRVLKAFTDARGIKVADGATGLLTHIGADFTTNDVTLDWTPDGAAPQTLTFDLAAKDGPRNNHMREYFEVGDYVAPPREPKPEPPPEPAPAPEDLLVDCACGPAFHRLILPAGRLDVAACLCCGRVRVTRREGDDGRFTGKPFTAHIAVATPPAVLDWLARFPRVRIDYSAAPWRWPMSAALVRYPTLFYPRDLKARSAAEISAAESSLEATQGPMTRIARLRAAAGDIPRPPADLPEDHLGFAHVQETLHLKPGADLDRLIALAHLLSPASELAADLLIRRDDAYDMMMRLLASADDDAFSAGVAMLRDARPLFSGPDDDRLGPVLLKLLDDLPTGPLAGNRDRIAGCARMESILVAIADLDVRTTDMIAGLNQLAKKLARSDDWTTKAIRLVINELNGVDNRPAEYR